MNILGIVGSMRKHKHTATLVTQVLRDIHELAPTATTDVLYIAEQAIQPCRVVCATYCTTHPYQCSIADDLPPLLRRMIAADALVIGTPLYFRAPPAKFQAFIERLISMFFFYESLGDGTTPSPLKGKPCGLIGVAEYANPHYILEYLHDACTVLKMNPLRLDRFPYLGVAGQGDVRRDTTFNPFERSKDLAAALVREVNGTT